MGSCHEETGFISTGVKPALRWYYAQPQTDYCYFQAVTATFERRGGAYDATKISGLKLEVAVAAPLKRQLSTC